jgi:hypothetical protein
LKSDDRTPTNAPGITPIAESTAGFELDVDLGRTAGGIILACGGSGEATGDLARIAVKTPALKLITSFDTQPGRFRFPGLKSDDRTPTGAFVGVRSSDFKPGKRKRPGWVSKEVMSFRAGVLLNRLHLLQR